MSRTTDVPPAAAVVQQNARDWVRILAAYREPNATRSWLELVISVVPFVGLWACAWYATTISYPLAILLSILNGGFVVRLFAIQHDCGHGSFFENRKLADWTGRVLGIITLTPYDVWRRTHALHHSHSGDLGHRGIGDVKTLTVDEYNALSTFNRLRYRLYRHPVVMFGIGPTYLFFVQNRLPLGLMKSGKQYWISALSTNAAIVFALSLLVWLGGWQVLAFVFFPATLLAASAGVWLFYVQHQFEHTHWVESEEWQIHEAALQGSSHYDLPLVLRWMTANIGIHHVHHLYSRIPFYRLPEVLRDHKDLVQVSRLTLRQSLACAHLDLWDSKSSRLISFSQARAI